MGSEWGSLVDVQKGDQTTLTLHARRRYSPILLSLPSDRHSDRHSNGTWRNYHVTIRKVRHLFASTKRLLRRISCTSSPISTWPRYWGRCLLPLASLPTTPSPQSSVSNPLHLIVYPTPTSTSSLEKDPPEPALLNPCSCSWDVRGSSSHLISLARNAPLTEIASLSLAVSSSYLLQRSERHRVYNKLPSPRTS